MGQRQCYFAAVKVVDFDTREIGADDRQSAAAIRYDFTVDDADTYSRPWSGRMWITRTAAPMYEYACHEGNYSIANALSGARYEDRQPPAAKPAPAGGGAP